MFNNKLYLLLFLYLCSPAAFAKIHDPDPDIKVGSSVQNDTSMPLRDIFDLDKGANYHEKNKTTISALISKQLVKSTFVHLNAFQGIGMGLDGYQVTALEPDTNAGVGYTQIVQFANPDLAIFDKTTGQVATGFPKKGSLLWKGFTGPCENFASGRMTVRFEKLAGRWVLSQYAIANMETGPYYHCIAVSTTDDATGTYNRYAFQLDSASDYVRLSVWPDAYYAAFNMIGRISFGPLICAFDRIKMLAGQPAGSICKQLSQQESGPLLAANLSGDNPPPSGDPEYFMGLGNPNNVDKLILYKFHTDFAVPARSSVNRIEIPVSAYTRACNGTEGLACAVQPGTTTKLDVVANRLKSRLIYRKFPTYGAIVATHVIEGPQPKFTPAIRWYEFRVMDNQPSRNPILVQQGTVAPDSKARFAPSMNIDSKGNLVVGYTVSSSAVHPSPEMAYHLTTDPINTMKIQPLFTGLGSQTGTGAWGSTSKMVLDPADDCTMWYTSEYLQQDSSSKGWSTIIVNFKLPGCM